MPLRSLFVLVSALCASAAFADGPTAKEVLQKAKERGALNLVGLRAELKLVTAVGDKAKEQLLMTTARSINGKQHALARFSAPVGVAGVAVLTVEGKPGEGDDVSLYLPKLKRVRKVAKADRGKAFMDTDFSYADIVSTGASDDGVSLKGTEKVDGRDCYVLEGQGQADSPYGKVALWVDTQTFVPLRVDYADKEGQPYKKYRTVKLKAFKDRAIAAESTMENVKTGSKTTLTVLKLEESTLGEEEFTERALERG